MKLFIKLSVITFLGLLLSVGGVSLAQAETTLDSQQPLQEATALFIEGRRTANTELIHQAKDKLSLWLKDNTKTADKNTLAQILRSRASISIVLDDLDNAINDYKKSNQYDPIGEVQLGICFLEKEQGTTLADLQNCYAKAVQVFANKQVAKTNVNYLLARILSGDNTAITEYKSIIESAEENEQLIYKMAAQEYLEEPVYQQIIAQ